MPAEWRFLGILSKKSGFCVVADWLLDILKLGKIYLLAGHNQAKFGQDIKRISGLRPPKDCVHVHVSII